MGEELKLNASFIVKSYKDAWSDQRANIKTDCGIEINVAIYRKRSITLYD